MEGRGGGATQTVSIGLTADCSDIARRVNSGKVIVYTGTIAKATSCGKVIVYTGAIASCGREAITLKQLVAGTTFHSFCNLLYILPVSTLMLSSDARCDGILLFRQLKLQHMHPIDS
jgi:hypothetical protein